MVPIRNIKAWTSIFVNHHRWVGYIVPNRSEYKYHTGAYRKGDLWICRLPSAPNMDMPAPHGDSGSWGTWIARGFRFAGWWRRGEQWLHPSGYQRLNWTTTATLRKRHNCERRCLSCWSWLWVLERRGPPYTVRESRRKDSVWAKPCGTFRMGASIRSVGGSCVTVPYVVHARHLTAWSCSRPWIGLARSLIWHLHHHEVSYYQLYINQANAGSEDMIGNFQFHKQSHRKPLLEEFQCYARGWQKGEGVLNQLCLAL